MEKIIIDPKMKGAELFKFLRENRKGLIDQKKSMMKFTDAVSYAPYVIGLDRSMELASKAYKTSKNVQDPGTLLVKVVANTSLFIDSDGDLLLRDNAKKSIKERGKLIKHLKNHGRTLDDQVGDVKDIYYQDIPLKDLGYNMEGTGQALIFETLIKRDYDPSTYNKYKSGMVDQHSIGLNYVEMEVAFKDEEDEKEMDYWNKYYAMAINKDVADSRGYFYVIPQIKLIENSAVLFGSNQLTPTLQVDTDDEPEKSTGNQPLKSCDVSKAIKEFKFF